MAISLDGPDAQSHDSFRGVPGTFERAMAALDQARAVEVETQLQTTVTRRNMNSLWSIADLASSVGVRMWSVFFLVTTGRALAADDLPARSTSESSRLSMRSLRVCQST